MPFAVALKGTVQGVGCRFYCAETGRRCGVSGSASNRRDGSVLVIIDTDLENEARDFASALINNRYGITFFGRIDTADVYQTDDVFRGDYEW